MSDLNVKQNAQRIDLKHQEEVKDQQKTETKDPGKASPTQEATKDWEKFSDSHAKVGAPSVATKAEEQKRLEEAKGISVADLQRQLQLRGNGIPG